MFNSSRSKIIGTLLGSLALAACDGGATPADASDVADGSDVTQDIGSDASDTVTSDVQDVQSPEDVQDVVIAPDAQDVASDAPTCETDPIPEEFFVDTTIRGSHIEFMVGDVTAIGGPRYNVVRARIYPDRDMPTATIGDCRVYTTPNPARGTSYVDIGEITISYAGQSGMLTFDPSMSTYVSTDFSMWNLLGDMNATFAIAASSAGPAVNTDVLVPPIYQGNETPFMSTIADPSIGTISSTSDAVIAWAPRAAGEIMHVTFYDNDNMDGGPVVACAVHGCAGRIVIPMAAINTFPVGTNLLAFYDLVRMVPVPMTGRTVGATISTGFRQGSGLVVN
jgi:hypothetical protein